MTMINTKLVNHQLNVANSPQNNILTAKKEQLSFAQILEKENTKNGTKIAKANINSFSITKNLEVNNLVSNKPKELCEDSAAKLNEMNKQVEKQMMKTLWHSMLENTLKNTVEGASSSAVLTEMAIKNIVDKIV